MSSEIEELRNQILLLAKFTTEWLCLMQYRMMLLPLTGEERTSYVKYWGEKLGEMRTELEGTATVQQTLEVGDKFEKEFSRYVTATKIDTADKAMEIAHSFIKKYSPVALPLKAERKDDIWLVDIDVGALAVKVANVKVDARTGDVLSYDIPKRESKKS